MSPAQQPMDVESDSGKVAGDVISVNTGAAPWSVVVHSVCCHLFAAP